MTDKQKENGENNAGETEEELPLGVKIARKLGEKPPKSYKPLLNINKFGKAIAAD